jgi:LmbE family N-acetylglucosaminyl deacetylase
MHRCGRIGVFASIIRVVGHHIYLSPHLDDAVLSCGGLIAQQVASGEEVTVFTVCAGDAPVGELTPYAYELHRRWGGAGSPVAARRAEDLVACGRLGASVVHYPLGDAIYRRGPAGQALYPDAVAIFGALHPDEETRIEELAAGLRSSLPPVAEVYAPLALGGHVDHRLTRRAAERLERSIWYYRDLPYDLHDGQPPDGLPVPGAGEMRFPLASEEIDAWTAAAGEYHSQLTTFWTTFDVMAADLREYHDARGGLRLYRSGGKTS